MEVEADILPNGKFLATEIEIENNNHFDEFEIEGYIDSLGHQLVYVGGFAFEVNAQTIIRGRHGLHLSFSDLAAGMFIEVKALIRNDGTFLAKKIKYPSVE